MLKFFNDITALDVASVGGKALRLAELKRHRLPVPDGFVVTTRAHARYSPAPTLPEDFLNAVWAAFDELGSEFVAVRSSAISEDSTGASWAGQFESYLNISRAGLINAIQDCWASLKTTRAQAYGEALPGIAVLVQAMVPSRISGVMFTANPVTGIRHELVIESIHGLGEALVQGEVIPDHFVIHKSTGSVLVRDIAEKPTVTRAQLEELRQLAHLAEEYYGYVLDIEWTYDDNQLYLLQARPITTI